MGNDLKGLMRRLTGIRIEVSEDKRARKLEFPGEDVDAYLEKLGLTKQELLTDAFRTYSFAELQIRKAIIEVNSTAGKDTQIPEDTYPWRWLAKQEKLEKMRKMHAEACRSFHKMKLKATGEKDQLLNAIKKAKQEHGEAVCMKENLARVKDDLRGAHAAAFLLHDATRMIEAAQKMEQAAEQNLQEVEKEHFKHEQKLREQEVELYERRVDELERTREDIDELKQGWIIYVRFALFHPREDIDEAMAAGSPPTIDRLQGLARNDHPYALD
ncbi:hypothetical protein BFW01_g10420 [Lasiodiplodia theobromae]|uniref:Uncharacterized protein n=1 Tax=Lasiodiplodia theobromae TaxID=45133 RepID=A0A8H7IP15_9PEZI|nr:uncharacterized protein LTHEOB_6674 [Lasiodiplodia theobromae]KAF4544008.1 hypothetical protein LTHEOB_6674 [Lasiodiplodia theobromae]KAF9629217.1 hypothetical protein BFW01_g10420 [Lasiodiplodia theobromae]